MFKRFIATIFVIFCLLGVTMINVYAEEIPSQYREIIEKYIQAINEKWKPDTLEQNNMYSEMGFNYDNKDTPTTLDSYGYLLDDIDQDGSLELLLGSLNGYPGSVINAFTLDGNTAKPFLLSQYRDNYTYFGNNNFIRFISGGGKYYGEADYNFGNKSLNLDYSVFYDGTTENTDHFVIIQGFSE